MGATESESADERITASVYWDVLFVGGAPGSGKTTAGRAIASQVGYGSITGDDLAIAARMVTSPKEHPGLHLMGGLHHTTYFTESPADKLIRDAEAQGDAMWPIIERVANAHLQSGAPVVFDWWLLSPSTVAAMDDDRVASVWLYVDPEVLWARERRHGAGFINGSADPERMLNNFMSRSLWCNDLVRAEAMEHGLPLVHVSDQSIDQLVSQVRAAVS